MEDCRRLIKIANSVRSRLEQYQRNKLNELAGQIENLSDRYCELTATSSKIKKALNKGWIQSAKNLQQQIKTKSDDLVYAAEKTKQLANRPQPVLPEISTILSGLQQTEQDCGEITFNMEHNVVSIETDTVNLEDVYLGPFKIELHLNKLPELNKDTPYYCIALDPQPAATSDDVTHPHVSNDRLCEGDGISIIRAALEEGRLCDFFCIVTNILNTYNPDSPYVALDDWSGISCYDCGYLCDSENIYYCCFCERDYCESCSSYCRICDETVCLGCGGSCQFCEEFICSNCMKECSLCGAQCCETCLEENMCPTCIELERKDGDDKSEKEIQKINIVDKQKEAATNGVAGGTVPAGIAV